MISLHQPGSTGRLTGWSLLLDLKIVSNLSTERMPNRVLVPMRDFITHFLSSNPATKLAPSQ
jgi:hypothetical protein